MHSLPLARHLSREGTKVSFIAALGNTKAVHKFEARFAGIRKAVSADVVRQVDERTVKVIATDGRLDRAGEIVEPAGAVLDNYRKNPIVLFNHDRNRPIARAADVANRNSRIEATIVFPDAGV